MGLMDWDGSKARVEIVNEARLEQMRQDTWQNAL